MSVEPDLIPSCTMRFTGARCEVVLQPARWLAVAVGRQQESCHGQRRDVHQRLSVCLSVCLCCSAGWLLVSSGWLWVGDAWEWFAQGALIL